MKHIKKFNESLNNELQEFCERCLVYLIDDGFEVKVIDWSSETKGISLFKNKYISNSMAKIITFSWDEIKDHYIPFLKLIDRKYSLIGFNPTSKKQIRIKSLIDPEKYWYIFDLDDLINDEFDMDQMASIGILIKK